MKSTDGSAVIPSNQPLLVQFALLLFLVIAFSGLGSGLVQLIGKTTGMDYVALAANLKADAPIEEKNFIRLGLSIGHLMSFAIPSLLFMWLIHQKNWLRTLQINSRLNWLTAILGGLFMLLFFPLAQWTYWLNQQIPMPDWAVQQETLINQTIISLLQIEQPYELVLNLFVIGVLPAIGEELLFRGILQNKLARLWQQPQLAVWVSAFIFSAIHFQFQGFVPRMLLGAALGYLLVWTRNLSVPIIAHFVFNASQVVYQYLYYKEETDALDLAKTDTFPIWMLIGSLGLLFLISQILREQRSESRESRE